MPHDKNGRLVEVGDEVVLRGTVKSVQTNPDYCNCNVIAEYKPPGQMGFSVTCCTQETEQVGLTFNQLRGANVRRLPEFKNPKGEVAHAKADGSDWSPLEWGGATGGEMGELLNLLKKLRRGDAGLDDIIDDKGVKLTLREAIAKECADVVCYLDHTANQVGVDLGEAVRAKFNEVSERVGSKVKL